MKLRPRAARRLCACGAMGRPAPFRGARASAQSVCLGGIPRANNKTGAHSSPTRPTCAPFALIFASTHPTLISDLYLHHINPRDIRFWRPLSNSAKSTPEERRWSTLSIALFIRVCAPPRRGVSCAIRSSIDLASLRSSAAFANRPRPWKQRRPAGLSRSSGWLQLAGRASPSVRGPRSGLRPGFSLGFARFPPRSSFDPLRIY